MEKTQVQWKPGSLLSENGRHFHMGFFKDITNHHHNPKGRYNASIVVVTQRYPPPSALRVPQELENCFVANERQTKVVVMNPSNYHLIVRRGQLAFYDSIRAHILSLKIITFLLTTRTFENGIFSTKHQSLQKLLILELFVDKWRHWNFANFLLFLCW